MLKGLLWGRRGVWPSVTAWLALGIGRALSCCSGFGSFIKRQKGCLNLCLLWHFPLCADISLSVPSFRVTLYAEFLPMKARAKCILLIEVSGCILILEGQILWWSHPFHPPAWKCPQSCSQTWPVPLGVELSHSWALLAAQLQNSGIFPVTLHSLCWICLFSNHFAPRAAEWAQEGHWGSMILWWNASQWWIWRADSSTNSVLNSAPHLHPNVSKSQSQDFVLGRF